MHDVLGASKCVLCVRCEIHRKFADSLGHQSPEQVRSEWVLLVFQMSEAIIYACQPLFIGKVGAVDDAVIDQ